MLIWWLILLAAVTRAAIQPPPWADPALNPCSAQPGGWLKLYWPPDGQCYRIFQTGAPCPATMELSPGAGGAAECRCAPGHVQMHRDSPCYKIFTRGPCAYGQYVQPMRDDMRGRWGSCQDVETCAVDELFSPESKRCFQQFTRGPCPSGQLLVFSNATGLPECSCSKDGPLQKYYWPPSKSCHQFYTRGPCLEKGALFLPGPMCACHSGLTNFYAATGQCYELGTSGPCKSGQIFTTHGCTCKTDHVPWADGHCYRVYTKGPCSENQLVSHAGTCIALPCPRGKLYFPVEDACHRVGVQGPCPRGQLVLFEQSVRPAVEGISYRGMCG